MRDGGEGGARRSYEVTYPSVTGVKTTSLIQIHA